MPENLEVGTLDWQQLPDMPEGKWEPSSIVIDDKLYVVGGYIGVIRESLRGSKSVHVFDPKDLSWTQIQDLPSAISHIDVVLDGRMLWYAGGFKDAYPEYLIAEVWSYDLELDRFMAGPLLPEKRGGGGLGLLGRNLHYIGGLKPDRDTDSEDHWVLNLDDWANGSAEWTNAAPMPAPRNQFACVELEGEFYAIAGQFHHDSKQLDQPRVDIYDPKTDSWREGPPLPYGHSHSEGATFVHENNIYIVGGHFTPEGGKKALNPDILRLAPGGSWEVIGQLPYALSSPASAIIGDKLYVAGGFDGKIKKDVFVTDVPE